MDAGLMGHARNASQSAQSWQSYALDLQQKLATAQALNAGNEALKARALSELARVDPANYLNVQKNRQEIFNQAYYAAGSK